MSGLMASGQSPIGAKSAAKAFTVRTSARFIISVISATTHKTEIFWCKYNLSSSGMHGRFLSWTLLSESDTLLTSFEANTRGDPLGLITRTGRFPIEVKNLKL